MYMLEIIQITHRTLFAQVDRTWFAMVALTQDCPRTKIGQVDLKFGAELQDSMFHSYDKTVLPQKSPLYVYVHLELYKEDKRE